MANKTFSIKMDERDIEKLKKYHTALIKAGVISSKEMTFNALCKHLILDYISEDIRSAISEISVSSVRLEKAIWVNSYNLSEESFETLKECYDEAEMARKKDLNEAVDIFEELSDLDIIYDPDGMGQIFVAPESEEDAMDPFRSYWAGRYLDRMQDLNERFTKNELDYIVETIKQSSVSEDKKKELIEELRDKFEQRRLAFLRTQRNR
jgi:hypothetical protein